MAAVLEQQQLGRDHVGTVLVLAVRAVVDGRLQAARVQLVEARGREHRLSLTQGTIHARIWAPPKFFYVNTPAAVAVDLGCAYTLHVNPDGSGLVRVTHGWVAFQNGERESFIPEQAVCATRPGVGPGTPRYEDAPDAYAAALESVYPGRNVEAALLYTATPRLIAIPGEALEDHKRALLAAQ